MDSAIDIRPTYNPIGFMSEAAPVFAMVWGQPPVALRWKQVTRIPVPAGQSAVGIWMKWVTKAHMGLAHAVVELQPGDLVGLEWKAPGSIFGTGKITAVDLPPPTAMAQPTVTGAPADLGAQALAPPHRTRPVATVPLAAAPVAPAAAATAPAPAGGQWAPDPTGRFPHRWWDGTRWTDAVSDGTTTTSDPI